MTEQITQQSSNKEKHANASIGDTLRQAREACSYSITYVAAHTHLNEDVIVAIENDEHDKLSSPVFVKGYIRSYAKLLDIDVEPLLSNYADVAPVERVTPQVKRSKKVRSSGADPVVIWSSVTVVALMLGLLTTWWIHRDVDNPVELASVVEQFDNAEDVLIAEDYASEQQDPSHRVGLGDVDPKNISNSQNASPMIVNAEESEVEEIAEQVTEPASSIVE